MPEEARYDWLLNLPESEDLAKKVKEAMEAVEKYTAGRLPCKTGRCAGNL